MQGAYAISIENVVAAAESLKDKIAHPPVEKLPPAVHAKILPFVNSQPVEILIKNEGNQIGGAFKLRGALNATQRAIREYGATCVVTHSSGNHAQALSRAANLCGIRAVVVIPNNAPAIKVAAARQFATTEVRFCEPDRREETYEAVLKEYQEKGETVVGIPPYNHSDVMAGQGTVALEILDDLDNNVDVVLCPIGGGGLISGVATVCKSRNPAIKVIGVEPEIANDAYISKSAGKICPNPAVPKTIADGLRTNLKDLTWPCVRDKVDAIVTVPEKDILLATALMEHAAEPSGATTVAALFQQSFWDLLESSQRKTAAGPLRCVCIISGKNADWEVLDPLIALEMESRQDAKEVC